MDAGYKTLVLSVPPNSTWDLTPVSYTTKRQNSKYSRNTQVNNIRKVNYWVEIESREENIPVFNS